MAVIKKNPTAATSQAMANVQKTLEAQALGSPPIDPINVGELDAPPLAGKNVGLLAVRISEEEKALFKSLFARFGLSLSGGCLLSMRYLQQLLDEKKIEITKTGIREGRALAKEFTK
jgi:hypothetical protein